ncbi:hypothetical protein SCLCIDRAFT_1209547 [Scleroderma citrinum Foug A]|uniref:Uncharacterized protein n=1 Tax=Scleroderma citrinum Foug A TaxID=1036808 RepID=A0A0C3EJS0_9AGAM|nr:hypothetical protein SCLCIDRAFT_1209547 [Scleroderma citrinum Foug A]
MHATRQRSPIIHRPLHSNSSHRPHTWILHSQAYSALRGRALTLGTRRSGAHGRLQAHRFFGVSTNPATLCIPSALCMHRDSAVLVESCRSVSVRVLFRAENTTSLFLWLSRVSSEVRSWM